LARARNDSHKQATNLLFAGAFPDSPLGRPVLGNVESLKTISQQTVSGFYHRWYVPNNTTIVIVGDITPDIAEALVKKQFGKWERRKLPDETLPEKKPQSENPLPSEETKKPSPAVSDSGSRLSRTVVLALGYPLVRGMSLSEICTAEVLASILSDPTEGRLQAALKSATPDYTRVVPRKDVQPRESSLSIGAVDVEGEYEPSPSESLLAFSLLMDRQQMQEVRRVFDGEIRKIQKEAVPAGELDYTKRRVVGRYLFEIETYAGQARALGQFDMLGDYRLAQQFDDSVMRLKAADITALVERYLEPARQIEALFPIQGKR
jgi:zinc protease